jgi:hypothetical protein
VWTRAPIALFRWRGLLTGLLVATAVLAVASAGGLLFLSSAGSAALHRRLAPLSPSTASLSVSMELVFPRTHRLQPATWAAGPSIRTSDLLEIQGRRLSELASSAPELGSPILSIIGPTVLAARPHVDQVVDLRPVARTDFVSYIDVVERVPGRGLWIPESSADGLGAEPGDVLFLTSERTASVRIKGTYRSLTATAPLPQYWVPLARLIPSPGETFAPGSEPPAVALGGLPTIRRLAGLMQWRAEARWELPLDRYELEQVLVPDVVGAKLPKARRTLRDVGLDPDVRRKGSPEPERTVLRQRPLGGLEVQPGRTVTLVVAKPPPPPPPPPSASTCHSSYTGACLDPNASDYDCSGGSGDGPKYTGTVTVVGPDVFGLDGDGDGVGCE